MLNRTIGFLESIYIWPMAGIKTIDKFGENPDIPVGQSEDIWDYGGIMSYTADGGADYYVSSSDDTDRQSLKFALITEDSNGDWNIEEFEQVIAGQTKTKIITPSGDKPVRLYRIENEGVTSIAGTVYVYEDTTITAGVPADATKVRGKVFDGNNQTQMSHMTIPSGYTGFLVNITVGISKAASNAGAARFVYFSRRHGKVFKNKGAIGGTTTGSSTFNTKRSFYDIIPSKTDFKITVTDATATIAAYALYDLVLIKNELL